MAEFSIIFLDIPYNISQPEKSMFEKYFYDYQSDEWNNGASFIFIDDSSLEYSLVISEDKNLGFHLMYSSANINCYSLGNADLLNDFVKNADDMIMPKGTYISADEAWRATEDFLDNPKIPSLRIKWTTDDYINWQCANF